MPIYYEKPRRCSARKIINVQSVNAKGDVPVTLEDGSTLDLGPSVLAGFVPHSGDYFVQPAEGQGSDLVIHGPSFESNWLPEEVEAPKDETPTEPAPETKVYGNEPEPADTATPEPGQTHTDPEVSTPIGGGTGLTDTPAPEEPEAQSPEPQPATGIDPGNDTPQAA